MADIELVIKIPEEQIKKSLKESKYIHEDEGEKGFVNIMMHYTNASLEFVYVERKTDFYSCEYKILPKEHGRIEADKSDILEKISAEIAAIDINGRVVDDRCKECKKDWTKCGCCPVSIEWVEKQKEINKKKWKKENVTIEVRNNV